MKKIFFVYIFILLSSCFMIVEVVSNIGNGIVIYIDPGHGGSDGGAIGKDDTYEKDIVLSIAKKLETVLKKNKYRVIMTRDTDTDLASYGSKNRKVEDIHKRTRLINESECDLFISIHANSFPSGKSYGAQTFFNAKNENGKALAKYIQDSLILQLGNTYRLSKSINDVYLMDKANKAGCLIEVGFMSNPIDLQNLKDSKYQDRLVHSIYLGIEEYLKEFVKK